MNVCKSGFTYWERKGKKAREKSESGREEEAVKGMKEESLAASLRRSIRKSETKESEPPAAFYTFRLFFIFL